MLQCIELVCGSYRRDFSPGSLVTVKLSLTVLNLHTVPLFPSGRVLCIEAMELKSAVGVLEVRISIIIQSSTMRL
jgi:hypothetical protein